MHFIRDINELHFALQQSPNSPLRAPDTPGKTRIIGEKQALLARCKGGPEQMLITRDLCMNKPNAAKAVLLKLGGIYIV